VFSVACSVGFASLHNGFVWLALSIRA